MQLSYIQKKILTNLLQKSAGKYSELKPDEIENDLYNYHLQFLVKKGLIDKSQNYYKLSDFGKKYIHEIEPLDILGDVDKIRLSAVIILTKEENGKLFFLNQKRLHEPFFGDSGLIGGAVKTGESVTNAANRILKSNAGLTGKFELLGTIRKIRLINKNEIFNDMLLYVCYSSIYKGVLKSRTVYGENSWVSREVAVKNESQSKQGSKKLAKILNLYNPSISQKLFYLEERIRI